MSPLYELAGMDEYILVFAPPGVRLGETVNRLAGRLKAEATDIEDEIKDNPATEDALRAIRAPFTRPVNMESVTHYLPRLQIATLWKDAVARCLKNLEVSNRPVKILSGHLIYYSAKRSEFYSVIDPNTLSLKSNHSYRLRPTCVLLLIDDIYDMYVRLTQAGQLYSPSQVVSFLRRFGRDRDIDVTSLSHERSSSLTMGWEIRNLLQLLSWRHLETIMAENLALQLEARFLVWPLKGVAESIGIWLENSQAIPVYLSHPITDPRSERNQTGDWPTFASEVNQLQEMLSKWGITLVLPTGIDELRFQVECQQFTGHLGPRWPLIVEDEGSLLYSQPDEAPDVNYSDFLWPKYWNFEKNSLCLLEPGEYTEAEALRSEVDAFLQVLVREIEAQIASRDFLFIYHTDGLVVFRPYYAGKPRPTFSAGVDDEVSLWEDVVQLGEQKRVAFVHFEEDVKSMLEAKKDLILGEFIDTVFGLLRRECYIERDTVEDMVRNRGNVSEVEGILNRSDVAQRDRQKLKEQFPSNWRQGKIVLLKKYLTNAVEAKEQLIGV